MKGVQISKVLAGIALFTVLIFPVSCSTIFQGMTGNDLNKEKNKQKIVRFASFSPLMKSDMIVIDPNGRKVGYDMNDRSIVNQIPGAWYSGRKEAGQISIIDPIPGAYTFMITGNGEGEFFAEIAFDGKEDVNQHSFQGGLFDGTILTAVVFLDPEATPAIEFSMIDYR